MVQSSLCRTGVREIHFTGMPGALTDISPCFAVGRQFLSTLLVASNEDFQTHLQSHAEEIKSTVSRLLGSLPEASSPDLASLQERVVTLLAAEKEHETEVDRLRTERDLLEERLESANVRYMLAEKKVDRMKSQAVAKLEQQSQAGNGRGEGKTGKGDGAGSADATELNHEIETARKEAVAIAEKQKEQLDKLEAENESLTERVTTLSVKVGLHS